MSFASQPSLDFSVRESVRQTNPVSSVMAAEQIAPHVRDDQGEVLEAHYRNRFFGLDDFELSDIVGRKQTSCGKRRGELEHMGFIEKYNAPRFSSSAQTKSKVQAYRITKVGLEYFEANR